MCRNCKIIKRRGVVRVICTDPATSSARADLAL
jgi:ribosomal protein L36